MYHLSHLKKRTEPAEKGTAAAESIPAKKYSPDNFLVKALFLISAVSVTFILSIPYTTLDFLRALASEFAEQTITLPTLPSTAFILPSVIIGAALWLYLVCRKNLLQKIWKETAKPYCAAAGGLALVTSWIFAEGLCAHPDVFPVPCTIVFCILILYALYLFWKFLLCTLIPVVLGFIRGLDRVEKWYLGIIVICGAIAVPVLYSLTDLFYAQFNVFYEANSMMLYKDNSFNMIGTVGSSGSVCSIKHIIFGLFGLPFGIIAFLVSKVLFFVPEAYIMTIAILQIAALGVTAVLLSRLVKAKGYLKAGFLLIMTVAFPSIIFSLTIENYFFAAFWLVLFVYSVCTSERFKDWLFIGAVGTVTTSAVMFPFLAKKFDIKKYLSVACKAVVLFLLCGRLSVFGSAVQEIVGQTHNVNIGQTLTEKLSMYGNFVSSLLFAPESGASLPSHYSFGAPFYYSSVPGFWAGIAGYIVLAAAVCGFIWYRKERFAKICIWMTAFSVLLIGIVGWGANETVLFTFYFAWAVIALVYLAIHKLCANHPKIELVILICLAAALLVINIPALADAVAFGMQYYPTVLPV